MSDLNFTTVPNLPTPAVWGDREINDINYNSLLDHFRALSEVESLETEIEDPTDIPVSKD
jgi:hypothetical protein